MAMKLGVSLAKTMLLPSRFSQKSAMKESTSLSVDLAGMISRSFICLGGLKKCVPRKCALVSFDSPSDIFSMESPEVFVLTIVPGLMTDSTFFSNSAFILMSSATTSITQSTSDSHAIWSSKLPGVINLASCGTKKAGGLAMNVLSMPVFASLFLNSGDSLVSPFLISF